MNPDCPTCTSIPWWLLVGIGVAVARMTNKTSTGQLGEVGPRKRRKKVLR